MCVTCIHDESTLRLLFEYLAVSIHNYITPILPFPPSVIWAGLEDGKVSCWRADAAMGTVHLIRTWEAFKRGGVCR